ncbi:MAG: YXWGXW repeat-containing protein [Acidiferrobacterales bacterium]
MVRNIHKAAAVFFLALIFLAAPQASFGEVSIGVSVTIGPPALPVYVQPPCPGSRLIWIPGYWAWANDGYFWVPGTWVPAPRPGLLWTPGYWAWRAGFYVWNPGYWGPRVGYYGGIDYGFGYTGFGYTGGYWRRGIFFYNRSVNNVNVAVIHNTYYHAVVRTMTVNRISYNGGPGGIGLRPTRAQLAYARERHPGPTREQEFHEHTARGIRALRASVNRGSPMIAATSRPEAFRGRGVVPAARMNNRYQPHTRPMPPERRFPAPARQNAYRRGRPGIRDKFPGHRPPPNPRNGVSRPHARQTGRNPDRRKTPKAENR